MDGQGGKSSKFSVLLSIPFFRSCSGMETTKRSLDHRSSTCQKEKLAPRKTPARSTSTIITNLFVNSYNRTFSIASTAPSHSSILRFLLSFHPSHNILHSLNGFRNFCSSSPLVNLHDLAPRRKLSAFGRASCSVAVFLPEHWRRRSSR